MCKYIFFCFFSLISLINCSRNVSYKNTKISYGSNSIKNDHKNSYCKNVDTKLSYITSNVNKSNIFDVVKFYILYFLFKSLCCVRSELVAEFKDAYFISQFRPGSMVINNDSLFVLGVSIPDEDLEFRELNKTNGDILNEFIIDKQVVSSDSVILGLYQFGIDMNKIYLPNTFNNSLEVYSLDGNFLYTINNTNNSGFAIVENNVAYVGNNFELEESLFNFFAYDISQNKSEELYIFEKNSLFFPKSSAFAVSLFEGNAYFNMFKNFEESSEDNTIQVNKIDNGGLNIPLTTNWLNTSFNLSIGISVDNGLIYIPINEVDLGNVKVFDLESNELLEFGKGSPLEESSYISGIVAENNLVYITDPFLQRILVWEIKNVTTPTRPTTSAPTIFTTSSPTTSFTTTNKLPQCKEIGQNPDFFKNYENYEDYKNQPKIIASKDTSSYNYENLYFIILVFFPMLIFLSYIFRHSKLSKKNKE